MLAVGVLCALAGCGESAHRGLAVGAAPPPVIPVAPPTATPAVAPNAVILHPGVAHREQLSAATQGVYRFPLRRGEAAHLVIEQQGVDVVAALRAPAGQPLLTVDSPNSAHGPEHVFYVAAEDGEHVLEVRPFGKRPAGEYAVLLAVRRPATADDRRRADACRAVSDGDASAATGRREDYARASRHFAGAAALWTATGDAYPALVARFKLGRALRREERWRPAVEQWEEAVRQARELGVEEELGSLHDDLGLAYQHLGEDDRAEAAFEVALAGARRLGDLREETVALHNLALLAQESGALWQALHLDEQALTAWRTLGDAGGEATTLHNIGRLYASLGRLPEARDALARALRLRRAADDSAGEARTVRELGWVRCLEEDFAGCRRDLVRSLALLRELGDRFSEATTLDRLGSAWRDGGEPARAVAEYERAIAIYETLGDAEDAAITLSNLGEALTLAGDPAAGLARLDLAIPRLDAAGDPSTAGYAHFRRARALRALGRLDAARVSIHAALERLDSFRTRAAGDSLRTSVVASAHEHHEFAVDLLMELAARQPSAGHDLAVLALVERARARVLLDLVYQARGGAAMASLARGGELRRVDERIRRLQQRQDGGDEAALRRLLVARDLLLTDLRLADREPDAAPVLSPEAIQRQVLDRDTLLLVYALGVRRSFVWAVTADEVTSAVLPPRAEITTAVERHHRLVARPSLRGTAIQARLVAAEVSELLLGPVADRLGDRRLAIAADGVLARVPFAALPDPRGGGAPLVERHEVVTMPSASVLDAVRRRAAGRAAAPRLLAVVADPAFDRAAAVAPAALAGGAGGGWPAGQALTRATRSLGLADLRALPFTRREAAAIVALVPPGQALQAMGAAASRELAVSGDLSSYRIVHFATHAFLHPEHPELSGVVLSLYDRQGRPQDGFLRSYEIADLDLSADLVVLSACRTGVGKEIRGEGLVGLTHSFFQAGATRVLASLWDVDDAATARLMAGFYRELLVAGRTPAAALRAAQRAMRAEEGWEDPAHWAGFVLAGDWRGANNPAAAVSLLKEPSRARSRELR